jgi:hypothetical protein
MAVGRSGVSAAFVWELVMTMFTTGFSKILAAAAGAAVLGLMPALASAHPHHADVRVIVAPEVCAPVVVDHVDHIWIEPTYRTVTDRVWIAPVVEDREVHTWVPDRYETQDVEYREGHHHYFRREEVLVEPAHDLVERQQVVVTPGHWEDVQRQELVTPGYYEDQAVEARVVAPVIVEPRPEVRLDILGGWLHLR